MKFKTKLYLGFGLIFFLFIVIQFIHMSKLNQLNQDMSDLLKDYEMVKLANTIQDELNIFSRESRGTMANPPQELKQQFEVNKYKAIEQVNIAIQSLQKLDKRENSKELFSKLVVLSKNLENMERKSDELLKKGKTQEATQLFWYDSRHVREQMVQDVDILQKIQEQAMGNELLQSRNTYNLLVKMIYIYVFISLLIGIIVIIWLLHSITRNLNKVTSIMTSIAYSVEDQLPRIEVNSQDEIGAIAEAFNNMAQSLEDHAKKEKELKRAAEEQSWLKTKVAEIATMFPEIDDLVTLAQVLITKVTPMVGASYGVFYISQEKGEKRIFRKFASYAANLSEIGEECFHLGEGLVGQCALENRMIILNQVPDHYIKIASGIGMASPATILLIPVAFEGEVLGVIEVASFDAFGFLQQLLLQDVMGNIGISIKSIMNHMKVEKLLQESQALTEELQSQSEELQLQQEELKTMNEQLEEQYEKSEQKSRELEKVKLILEEKAQQLQISSQYKTEFLANMSHELRTPLNSLLILAQMLMKNEEGNLSSKQLEYMKTIFVSGNSLLNLINDILDLAKVESGKMEVYPKNVRLLELKTFVEAQFNPIANQKNIRFFVHFDPNLPDFIYTDEQKLQQILNNLLSNAFKFTEKGNVTLQIKKIRKEEIKKKDIGKYKDDLLAISVIDTGIGIPQEKQKIIFEAFKQMDGTTNRKYGGTGLGLSISQDLARLLGGRIDVESVEASGSTFTLYIPNYNVNLGYRASSVSKKEIAAGIFEESEAGSFLVPQGSKETERKALLKGKKVLIVDDDMRNVFALMTMLESYNMKAKFAENGREGIEILLENPDMDIILMDIMMPEMDGYEAIKEIRDIPDFRDIPILALTAKAMSQDRKKCIEAGASDYISKPLNLDQLLSLMKVWLYR